jgi:hypothetical protein
MWRCRLVTWWSFDRYTTLGGGCPLMRLRPLSPRLFRPLGSRGRLVPKEYISLISVFALVACLATSITSWSSLVALLLCQPHMPVLSHLRMDEWPQGAYFYFSGSTRFTTLTGSSTIGHAQAPPSWMRRPAPDVEVEGLSTGQRLAQVGDGVGSSRTTRRKSNKSTSSSA